MSTQKLMIVLLVALVVIFLITVGMGGCHGSGNTDRPGAVSALKGLQGKRFLEIGDKASVSPTNCAGPGPAMLTVNGTCLVTFEKRAFFRRSTRVVFRANRPMAVVVDPKDGPRQDEQLNAFECFASAVNHSGGAMSLTSPSGVATVFLLREPCPE